MARIGEVNIDPHDPVAVADILSRAIQILDQEVEFGDPVDPQDPTSGANATGLATTHNGRLANVVGSWVEGEFDTRDSPVNFRHNLNIPVYPSVGSASAEPNVRWMALNLRHDGTGSATTQCVTVMYDDRDAASITEDIIPLRMFASGARTIDSDHPIKVSIFFVPAVRWP